MRNVSALLRHASWNLLGFGIPLVAAVFTIPILIHGLGVERFGMLTIGWVIVGYFAMFDFGMGQATTRAVATCVAEGDDQNLPTVVWSSFAAHFALGLCGAVAFLVLVPRISSAVLGASAEMRSEVSSGFYVLAASIPFVVGGTCLRGVLEGVRRFDLVNKVKIPAGIMNYVGPIVVLQFTTHLLYIIGVIVIGRCIVLAVYFLICLRTLPQLRARPRVKPAVIKPLLSFGGWVSISTLTLPLITSLDRFIIGSVISIAAVSYYATPYEVVTKLWMLSGSLLSALFPVFSTLSVDRGAELRPLGERALRYLLVLAAPPVAVLFAFAYDLLLLWIGPEFARHGGDVTRWLAAGVLLSILAQVPFTVLQGWGRADVPAKLQLIQWPLYGITAYYIAGRFGITGVAVAWASRAALELVALTLAADRLLPPAAGVAWVRPSRVTSVFALLAGCWILGSGSVTGFGMKLSWFSALFAALMVVEWSLVLDANDRKAIANLLRRTGRMANGAAP